MRSPPPSEESTQGETQFIPKSDDDETLWEVIEITAEQPGKYKVRWSGEDPFTGRPWPQSWVPKSDCTDDLRRAWKNKRKQKEEAKKKGRDKSRPSTSSRKSTVSTSTVTNDRHSATVGGSRPPESYSSSHTSNKPESFKRKRHSRDFADRITISTRSNYGSDLKLISRPEAGSSHPHKRHKIGIEDIEPAKKKHEKAIPRDSDAEFDEEDDGVAKVLPAKKKDKGKGKATDPPSNDEQVPFHKMGPPRGANKSKHITTLRKSSSTSSSKTPLKSDISSMTAYTKHKKEKPSPGRFRASPAPLYTDGTPPKESRSRKRVQNAESDDETDLGCLDQYELHAPLFHPSADDGYPNNDVESHDLVPQTVSNTTSDDGHIDYDSIPPSRLEPPVVSRPNAGPSGGYVLSPEVPGTQSQPSDDAQRGTAIVPPESTPKKPSSSSASSKMKPKSKSKSADGQVVSASTSKAVTDIELRTRTKPLRPVPQLSPSTFHPHLPVSGPDSSRGQDNSVEMEDAPPSSIESFGSAEQKKNGDSDKLESIRNWGTDGDGSTQKSRDMIFTDDNVLRMRGQELADVHQREKEMMQQKEREKGRRPLSEVIKEASREPEFERVEELIVQEMEDAYVDLSGGGDDQEEFQVRPTPLEEEETTQDLELERERRLQQLTAEKDVQMKSVNESQSAQGINIEPPIEQVLVENSTASMVSKPKARLILPFRKVKNVDEPSPTPSPPQRSTQVQVPSRNTDLTVSKPKAKPILPFRRVKSDEELPPTLSPPRHSVLAQVPSQSQSPTHHLDSALNLLNLKSEEILQLQASLAFERQRNENLAVANQRLEEALALANAVSAQANSDATALNEARIQWSQTKAAWDEERQALIASVETLTRSKASAEADRDFFRDQYTQASTYVGSVRNEITELEDRVLVAENQAKDGVGMIKATYGRRLKVLEMDMTRWKSLAELLQEKDRKTGDDVRRRAAEEPELRAKNADLIEEVNRLQSVLIELSRERQVLQPRPSNVRNGIVRQAARHNNEETGLLNGQTTSYDNKLVYRCLWRPEGDYGPCLNVFSSTEDLEAHMFSDAHLVVLNSRDLPESL